MVFEATGDYEATLSFSGMTLDMTNLIGGLLPWQIETYSPVPGVEKFDLAVKFEAAEEEGAYSFEATEDKEDRTTTYSGTVSTDGITIDIKNTLKTNPLAGGWELAKVNTSSGSTPSLLSPLWLDVNSNVFTHLGKAMNLLTLNGSFNKIFNTLCGPLGSFAIKIKGVSGIEKIVSTLLKGFELKDNGDFGVSYMYNIDAAEWTSPLYSSEMPANVIRYYYEGADIVRVEVNAAAVADLVGGLISGASTKVADPEITKEIGRKLIEHLNPVLAAGIPIKYEFKTDEKVGDVCQIWIDETWMLKALQILAELGSDEYALDYITPILGELLGDQSLADIVKNLLIQLPDVLKYSEGYTATAIEYYRNNPNDRNFPKDPATGEKYESADQIPTPSGECTYAKIGLKLVKAAAEAE